MSFQTAFVQFLYNADSQAEHIDEGHEAALRALKHDFLGDDTLGAQSWDALDAVHRAAVLGELKRRFAQMFGAEDQRYVWKKIHARTRGWEPFAEFHPLFLKEASQRDAQPVADVAFSQFATNFHFQGNYEGQPDWLSDKSIVECAATLRGDPTKSLDMRLKLYRHAGRWVCLNNRGLVLHSLASVAPRRLVFVDKLSSEETKRMHSQSTGINFDLSKSLPTSRRQPSWHRCNHSQRGGGGHQVQARHLGCTGGGALYRTRRHQRRP